MKIFYLAINNISPNLKPDKLGEMQRIAESEVSHQPPHHLLLLEDCQDLLCRGQVL